jgi:glucose-1-phosphate adenylyltransferase
VHAHLFDGYWEDIGTIRSFYDANLALTQRDPPFDFLAQSSPVYTHARFLPPTRVGDARVSRSLLADGCQIGDGAVIEDSIIGLRCRIGKGVTIKKSVLMGADYFAPPTAKASSTAMAAALGVGDGSHIEGAIIDKNCRIGKNVRIQLQQARAPNEDSSDIVIRDGIVVVPKETVLPDNWSL